MIKDHAEIERVLKNDLESIEFYFAETRKTVVNALSTVGEYYDTEKQGELEQSWEDLSREVALTLSVALCNIASGLDAWRQLHKRIELPCERSA